MELQYGSPFTDKKLHQLTAFLKENQLDYEQDIEFTVNLVENGKIAATGSLAGNIVKCVAVDKTFQGSDLASIIITELYKKSTSQNISHLLLFTKPDNKDVFSQLGFFEISSTQDILLMENNRNGIGSFIETLKVDDQSESGCVIMNCNPFTNGHLYLIEAAVQHCKHVYVFVLSEDKSEFSTQDRMRLVKEGTAHISNISVHPTGQYMISSATFPSYFLKEKARINKIHCQLDLQIFADWFAPALNITQRFVGSEPYCELTMAYNRQMKEYLPSKGIKVVELPRLEAEGSAVSASCVRRLLHQGRLDDILPLVPPSTYSFLRGMVQFEPKC